MMIRAKNESEDLFRPAAATRIRISGFLVLIGLCLWTSADRADAVWSKRECKAHTLVDFGAVLDRMRPPAQIPAREKLPFAPEELHLSPTERATVGPAAIGFFAYRDNRGDFVGQLGWPVISRLSLVRRSGAPLRVLSTRDQSFDPIMGGKIDSSHVGGFRVSSRTAFYRVDVEFKHQAGTIATGSTTACSLGVTI